MFFFRKKKLKHFSRILFISKAVFKPSQLFCLFLMNVCPYAVPEEPATEPATELSDSENVNATQTNETDNSNSEAPAEETPIGNEDAEETPEEEHNTVKQDVPNESDDRKKVIAKCSVDNVYPMPNRIAFNSSKGECF